MKRISEKKVIIIANIAKIYLLKLVPELKRKKLLKLLLVDVKANSSILMRFEMTGISENKQKYSHHGPSS